MRHPPLPTDSPTVLVTGADGFLGGHVARAVAARGVSVRRWTFRSPGDVQGDLLDSRLVDRAVAGIESVVHCAGVINASSGRDFWRVNVEATRRLGAAARAAGVDRFVFVSSSDVVFSPGARYGASKLAAEEALATADLADLRVVRPTVIYGPGDRKNVWTMVQLARRVPVAYPLPGPGAGRRQPIWVEDVARALARLALEEGGAPVRHLGGPERLTVRQMVELILDATGLRRRIVAVPVAGVLGRLGGLGCTRLLREHTEQLLSFEADKAWSDEPGQWTDADGPRTGFAEGLRRWLAVEGAFGALAAGNGEWGAAGR